MFSHKTASLKHAQTSNSATVNSEPEDAVGSQTKITSDMSENSSVFCWPRCKRPGLERRVVHQVLVIDMAALHLNILHINTFMAQAQAWCSTTVVRIVHFLSPNLNLVLRWQVESRLNSFFLSLRCLGLWVFIEENCFQPDRVPLRADKSVFLCVGARVCVERKEAFGKCSLMSVNRVISSSFCVLYETPFFLPASNQSLSPSPSLPSLFFFLLSFFLFVPLLPPPPSLLKWEEVGAGDGEGVRGKKGRGSEIQKAGHKEEKEILQCFFNMCSCGPGCLGAFVWDPLSPPPGTVRAARSCRGLWEKTPCKQSQIDNQNGTRKGSKRHHHRHRGLVRVCRCSLCVTLTSDTWHIKWGLRSARLTAHCLFTNPHSTKAIERNIYLTSACRGATVECSRWAV